MFQKIFAAIGLGGTKVDLVLPKEEYTLGEELKGKVIITGGRTHQEVDDLNIDLNLFSK